MATLRNYTILKKNGIRPKDDVIYYGIKWYVGKGEPYDLIKFSIEEIDNYYWEVSLAVPCGTRSDTAKYLCERYISSISDADIEAYKGFLEDGEKWGWD